MTVLYLVRHGATAANERQPYVLQGCRSDLPLSDTGESQAAAAAHALCILPINHAYCSPLLRARQTAAAIAAPHRLTTQSLADITECDVGEWEGLSWTEIEQRYPAAFRAFQDDPASHPYLGGESFRDVFNRVGPAFDNLFRQHAGETFVVVAHNVVNRVYLAQLLGIDLRRSREIVQNNCGINVVTHDGQRARVQTLNASFHLTDLPVAADTKAA